MRWAVCRVLGDRREGTAQEGGWAVAETAGRHETRESSLTPDVTRARTEARGLHVPGLTRVDHPRIQEQPRVGKLWRPEEP